MIKFKLLFNSFLINVPINSDFYFTLFILIYYYFVLVILLTLFVIFLYLFIFYTDLRIARNEPCSTL